MSVCDLQADVFFNMLFTQTFWGLRSQDSKLDQTELVFYTLVMLRFSHSFLFKFFGYVTEARVLKDHVNLAKNQKANVSVPEKI